MKTKINILSFGKILFVSMFLVPFTANALDTSNCTPRTFIVSWYYSATPDQNFYYRANYEQEIRLNWRWTHGASGRAVFNGMIAAPRNYAFWTKIYFPQHWVWKVHDRGQAIVNAWQRWYAYDRIDIWMGHWQEWLKRALSFGKKTMKGYVCHWDVPVWFDFSSFQVHEDFFEVALWWVYLTPNRNDEFVKTMQSYLYRLWYLDYEHQTGFFWPITRQAVCSFQSDRWLASPWQSVCGYFGPKTRQAMKDVLVANWIFDNNQYKRYVATVSPEKDSDKKISLSNIDKQKWWDKHDNKQEENNQKENNQEENDSKMVDKEKESTEDKFVFKRGIWPWENSAEVGELQKALAKLDYFDNEINYYYDDDTLYAVYDFQLSNWILDEDADNSLKWYFWPSTRSKLNSLLSNL